MEQKLSDRLSALAEKATSGPVSYRAARKLRLLAMVLENLPTIISALQEKDM